MLYSWIKGSVLPSGLKDRDEARVSLRGSFWMRNQGWVIDGIIRLFCQEERLEQADQILFYLALNRFTCFRRAYYRFRVNKGAGAA